MATNGSWTTVASGAAVRARDDQCCSRSDDGEYIPAAEPMKVFMCNKCRQQRHRSALRATATRATPATSRRRGPYRLTSFGDNKGTLDSIELFDRRDDAVPATRARSVAPSRDVQTPATTSDPLSSLGGPRDDASVVADALSVSERERREAATTAASVPADVGGELARARLLAGRRHVENTPMNTEPVDNPSVDALRKELEALVKMPASSCPFRATTHEVDAQYKFDDYLYCARHFAELRLAMRSLLPRWTSLLRAVQRVGRARRPSNSLDDDALDDLSMFIMVCAFRLSRTCAHIYRPHGAQATIMMRLSRELNVLPTLFSLELMRRHVPASTFVALQSIGAPVIARKSLLRLAERAAALPYARLESGLLNGAFRCKDVGATLFVTQSRRCYL